MKRRALGSTTSRVSDVTNEQLASSSNGPGETTSRVAKAKPAKTLTPTLQATLDKWNRQADRSLGYTSKPLAYGFDYPSKSEHSNLIRLVKGGHLRLCQVEASPPEGSRAKRHSPYADRYYILRESCPVEVSAGTLYGVNKRRRK